MDVRGRHAEYLRQHGEGFAPALARALLFHALRRRVFLHIHVTRFAAIQVDGKGVFRHVGIVEAIAFDPFALRPGLELAQILAQPVCEHLRTGPLRPVGAHDFGRALYAAGLELEAQQAALDRAVQEAMAAFCIDPEVARQRRIAGQDRRLPALEPLAHDETEFSVERRQ